MLVESFYDVEYEHLLPTIEVPVLVVHGDADGINPPDNARQLAKRLPDAELLLLDGAGHVPTLSRPVEVAAAIERFADRVT